MRFGARTVRVAFGQDETGEFVAFDYGRAAAVRLFGDDVPEALKAVQIPSSGPKLVDGKRVTPLGTFTVPAGARWVWLKFANEGEDLQGEVMDIATLKEFAPYTVSQAGWLDYNHLSRPARFPKAWIKEGASPQDFIIGKITDLRFAKGHAYAEAYLWPKGHNPHADRMWQRLCDAPESIHCSAGGAPIDRLEEVGKDGRMRKRLKLLMNHIALCDQAINPNGTEARLAPYPEFLKALVDGVPSEPDCDGETCVGCFFRGGEALKGVTAGDAAPAVREDLEGAARPKAGGKPCPRHSGPKGRWRSLNDAVACLRDCHGMKESVARDVVGAALTVRERDVA